MPETRVGHVNDPGGFDIYIGRAVPRRGFKSSPWANPFRIGRDGDRAEVIAKYRDWIQTQPELMARLGELRGRVLACWCKSKAAPETPCHGNVLKELVDATPR